MVLEYYAIAAASFGVATFFGMYKKARNTALEVLEKKEDSGTYTAFSFVVWWVLATIAMPLMVLPYVFNYDKVVNTMTDALVERMEEDEKV